jgi:acyl-CoA reductase-like NAD-dependent aldehyde dehydrogenase
LLLNGYKAQVWIEPGVSGAQTRMDAAKMYRGVGYDHPGVCLVLGAGNLGSITTLDVLDQLYAHGRVCVVKMNPVNDYLGPFYEKIFSEFVSRGWLRFVYGGADAGGYLAHHRKTDSIHMTGSATTYDAIVWGTDAEIVTRKANNTPILDKSISAELGGISPFIVVPGEWSEADIRFQAEHLATSKLNDAGHNCIATQVLVLSEDWPHRRVPPGCPPDSSPSTSSTTRLRRRASHPTGSSPTPPPDAPVATDRVGRSAWAGSVMAITSWWSP